MKAQWKEVEHPGMREFYVAIVQGREIGTIGRIKRNSAWNVYAGIGQNAVHVGNYYSKEGAKYALLSAPEKYWQPQPAPPEFLHTARNDREGTEARVALRTDGKYAITVRDAEANKVLPYVKIMNSFDAAKQYAEEVIA